MRWEKYLEDLEPSEEQDYTKDATGSNSTDSGEHYYTYARHKKILETLKELEEMGEDCSASMQIANNKWKKSECNPENIAIKLTNPEISIDKNYYETIKNSLLEMQSDGQNVDDVLKRLEECWVKSELNRGISDEITLETLLKELEEPNIDHIQEREEDEK